MNTKEKLATGCCGTSEDREKFPSTSDADCCVPPNEANKEAKMKEIDSTCCGTQSASTLPSNTRTAKRIVNIDFMYLDLSVCTRCQGTESRLEEAVAEVANILETTGVQVSVKKIHVKSEEQARELGFLASPTIRVNGRDIQMNFRESRCESCDTLCDCEGGVSCREWEYQGQWYAVPPKGLIIEAILKEVYGGAKQEQEVPHRAEEVPGNLKRFFGAVK